MRVRLALWVVAAVDNNLELVELAISLYRYAYTSAEFCLLELLVNN